MEAEAVATTEFAPSDTDINWDRLDKTKFHVIGAVLFTAQSALIHPTAVVKTRMQVAGSGLSQMRGTSVFSHILKNDGIPGLFRGFGTSAIGSMPGRVLALTSLEMSKDFMLKYTEDYLQGSGPTGRKRGRKARFSTTSWARYLRGTKGLVWHVVLGYPEAAIPSYSKKKKKYTEDFDMPEASRIGLANGVAGMFSNLVSCVYFVPMDVICQRQMVQGLPGTTHCSGPIDVVRKVMKAEGFRGIYRGFGLTAVTQSPASALWWGSYGAAQHIIWRSLGYRDGTEKKPSHTEMVTVQATAGMVAGACSSIITTPIDTVKTRLQVMDNYGGGRPSVLKTAKTLLKEDGWWGFYRGFGPRFLNISLYGTTMIVTYELIKRLSIA